MIDPVQHEAHFGGPDRAVVTQPEPHDRRRAERQADDMLDHRPVALPTDAGASP